jgi:hypothetical protein
VAAPIAPAACLKKSRRPIRYLPAIDPSLDDATQT